MLIDRIYQPVETLGPGRRIVVWTQGCSKGCPGCANPELQPFDRSKDLPARRLADLLVDAARASGIHRITFTGGDPLEQAEELLTVLKAIHGFFDDILVYTGYERAALDAAIGSDLHERIERTISVLIDGPYVEALNDGRCALRGSTNQNVYVLDGRLRHDYDEALERPRAVQNVVFSGRALSIGIHSPTNRTS